MVNKREKNTNKNENLDYRLRSRIEHDTILKVRDLHISFSTKKGKIHAIRGVDFDLKRGECIAIVGESGSGKSATVKALSGLMAENAKIESGSIELTYKNEYENLVTVDVAQMDKKWIRKNLNGKRIAMVFQDPMTSLDPLMPIGKQIMEGMLWNDKELTKDVAKTRAMELLNEVGITDVETTMKQFPHELSGGMRQRVVIAIALSCDPEILICDEPTTALDVTMQAKILDLIVDLQIKRDLSVIFITHNLGVVAKVADYIYVMYAGKVVEKGNEIDIFFNPKHPYTWGLLASMPQKDTSDKRLYCIPGTPPNLLYEVKGDAFAPRNKFAMKVDYKQEPPMFQINRTHFAATWLLDERAPKIDPPEEIQGLIKRLKKELAASLTQ